MTSDLMTPDGRYFVQQGRLWRAPNPTLAAERQVKYTRELLNGRRALKAAKLAGDETAVTAARQLVAAAQVGLGERGRVWWKDGAPDYNRMQVKQSPYADWFATVDAGDTVASAI